MNNLRYLNNISERYREEVSNAQKRDFFEERPLVFKKPILLYGEVHTSKPVISIVVTTFRRNDLLYRCLLSIKNQLTMINFEVVVIDNDPENKENSSIIPILKELNDTRFLYYCNTENLGHVGNWNNGMQLAHGEWVSLVHDDDILHPLWLETILKVYDKYGKIADVISCKLQEVSSDAQITDFIKTSAQENGIRTVRKKDIKKGLVAPILGAWVKKDFFIKLGGFGLETHFIEDYIFMGKAVLQGNVIRIDTPLYGYWISNTNDSANCGIWDAVIISEYYYRKQLLKKLHYNTGFIDFYSCFKVERAIMMHNQKWMKLCAFNDKKVDTITILQLCGIPYWKHILLYPLTFLYSLTCVLREK